MKRKCQGPLCFNSQPPVVCVWRTSPPQELAECVGVDIFTYPPPRVQPELLAERAGVDISIYPPPCIPPPPGAGWLSKHRRHG
eukprot:11409348-Karenia_brevis.AAC.1